MQRMHCNILCMFDFWANPLVNLLLLKSSTDREERENSFSYSVTPQVPSNYYSHLVYIYRQLNNNLQFGFDFQFLDDSRLGFCTPWQVDRWKERGKLCNKLEHLYNTLKVYRVGFNGFFHRYFSFDYRDRSVYTET